MDCHIGSQLTSLRPLRDALIKVKQIVIALRGAGQSIELIDVGGGLGVEYSDADDPPTPEAYAEMVLEVVGHSYSSGMKAPSSLKRISEVEADVARP